MKKIIILILTLVVIIVSMIFVNYIEYAQNKTKIEKLNKELTAYKTSNIQINTVVTLMNKAIQLNIENKIMKDENDLFYENDTNSIKMFLEIKSRESMIPMEKLMGQTGGAEKVQFAFSDLIFKITDIEYHSKTGQVKKIIFTAQEEQE